MAVVTLATSELEHQYAVVLTWDSETCDYVVTYGAESRIHRYFDAAMANFANCVAHAMECVGAD